MTQDHAWIDDTCERCGVTRRQLTDSLASYDCALHMELNAKRLREASLNGALETPEGYPIWRSF